MVQIAAGISTEMSARYECINELLQEVNLLSAEMSENVQLRLLLV